RDGRLYGRGTADMKGALAAAMHAFRDAHEVVGGAVRHAIDRGCDLAELSLDELRQFSSAIEADVFDVLTLAGSTASRDHLGGTAPRQVETAVARARERIDTVLGASPPPRPSG
ncbi:MAG: argininosuccinate lyase, partial [Proteobacteria bacterium SW_6_67_9]